MHILRIMDSRADRYLLTGDYESVHFAYIHFTHSFMSRLFLQVVDPDGNVWDAREFFRS